jgi:AraC-like DNA-binding protein
MDAIAGLLDGPRARGAFLLRSSLDPPWSIRLQDESPLTLVAIVRGEVWVVSDDGEERPLRPGDAAIIKGPDPYTLADDPATSPQVVVHPGQRCTTPDGHELKLMKDLGVRTWGNSPNGSTVMLCGAYQMAGEISRRLLKALPRLLVLPDDAWNSPLIPLLADEIVKDDPGQEAVLDRLLDLLLIAVLRAWFARAEAQAPAWYRAHSDPVVGPALRLIHNDPAHPWTVAELAAETGLSRAAFARRFAELVGQSPMAFLTEWRLALAADLLLEPDATIASVAEQVGYGSPFALSAAFKRVRGMSPREHRIAGAASAGDGYSRAR